MQNFNFSYDKENDDLFLYSKKSKSSGSVELGDLIFDYDSKKQLVGIQIMNASELIADLVEEPDSGEIKDILDNLTDSKVTISYHNNLIVVKILLFGKNKELAPIISTPYINKTSPALAYV